MEEQHTTRPVALVADAGDSETQSFKGLCTSESHSIIANADRSECVCVWLIGAGMAEAAWQRIRPAARTFTLLVSYDESVLRNRELLERCANVLVAPFDTELLAQTLRTLCEPTELDPGSQQNIIGRSPQIRELLRVISLMARCEAPVLIKGETGTGKELVARAIHYNSARRDHAFVPVNCGALNDELLIAELFGYEKGAFTDAKRAHRGLVDQAAAGVLFLDEIDSLSARGQAALLRFLQEQEYRPLGSNSVVKSDVRIITATNKDLLRLVTEGRFREDLYYRVQLLDIPVPPLRDRVGDVEVLADHFLALLSERYGVERKQLHPLTRRWMTEYPWLGNVRELQNFLHRVFVLSPGPTILVPRVKGDPVSIHGPVGGEPAESHEPDAGIADGAIESFNREKLRAVQEFERKYLQQVMSLSGGNVSLAARHAGKERRAFRRLLKKYGIDRQRYVG